MAKFGAKKLSKLKSILKSIPSFSGRTTMASSMENKDMDMSHGLHPVYVGKSKRRYMISPKIVGHPLVQELLQQEGGDKVVECEVVLFEHLLWMLENGEAGNESLDLVQYYVY